MERLQSDKDKNKLLTLNSFYLETDNFKIYICYTFLGDAFMTEIRKDVSELWSTEYRVGHLLKIIPLFNQKYFTNFA